MRRNSRTSGLVEPAPCCREVGVPHRRRRGRVGARERDGHIPSVDGMFTELVSIPRRATDRPPAVGGRRAPRRCSPTTISSTSSPATSLALAISASDCPAGTMKCAMPGLAHRRHLLRQPADRPDRAVELHRAGDGDVDAAEQVALGQLVEQRQRERQPGARPADLAGVEGDLERQAHRPGVEGGRYPMIALARVRRATRSARPRRRPRRRRTRRRSASTVSPGSLVAPARRSGRRSCPRRPVDGDDGVAVVELVGARDVLGAPLPVDPRGIAAARSAPGRGPARARSRPA